MAEMLPPVIAQLLGDVADALDKLAKVQAAIDALKGADVTIDIHTAEAITKIEDFQYVADSVHNPDATVQLSIANALARLSEVEQAEQALSDAEIDINANATPALTKMAEVAAAERALSVPADELAVSWDQIALGALNAQEAILGARLAAARAARQVGDIEQEIDALRAAAARPIQMELDDLTVMARLEGLKAEMGLLEEPVNIPLNLEVGQAETQMALLGAQIAMLGAEGGGGGAGGGLGGLGAAAGAAGGFWTWVHAIHLAMPEIIGLISALAVTTVSFAVLGIAAASTLTDIVQGYRAVSSAQDAITAAIPGTTQWSQAIGQLGQSWSTIPGILQPAVAAIDRVMTAASNSPQTLQIQSWLSALFTQLGSIFGKASGIFEPLIVATEQTVETLVGMFQRALGSGGISRLVHTLSVLVGPMTIELVQMAVAIAKIGVALAQAVTDGAGLEVLVSIFRSIQAFLQTSFVQGFIAGWVDFDRLLATIIGLFVRLVALVSEVLPAMRGFGVVVGFLVSILAALTSIVAILRIMGASGASAAVAGLRGSFMGLARVLVGPMALVGGLVMFNSSLTALTGVANPIGALFHGIASALGFVSKSARQGVNTVSSYAKSLHASIPEVQQLTAAQDLLVRSEQSLGGSLGQMSDGFQRWSLSAVGANAQALNAAQAFTTVQQAVQQATDSVNSLIGTLQAKNQDLASWAVDAQQLIQRGMDPSAVASLAQQAPQDLASMVGATTGQLQTMNTQWEEQMLLAQMSGQHGVAGFVNALQSGILKGTPTVKAAATALAQQMAQQLGIPFTGTKQNIQQIGAALQTLPTSVLQTLAGKAHQVSAATLDAGHAAKKLAQAHQSAASAAISLAASLGMIVMGVGPTKELMGELTSKIGDYIAQLLGIGPASADAAAGTDALAGSEDAAAGSATLLSTALSVGALGALLLVAAGIYELYKHFGLLKTMMIVGTAAVFALGAAFIFVDAIPIVALIAGIGLAIAGLVAGIIYLATHWHQVWTDIKKWAEDAWRFLDSGLHKIPGWLLLIVAPLIYVAMHWNAVWSEVRSIVQTVWGFLDGAFNAIRSTIVSVWDSIFGFLNSLWHSISSTAVSVWSGIVAFFTGIPGDIVHALGALLGLLTATASAAWNGFWQTAVSVVGAMLGWVGQIPGDIMSFFANAGSWLYDAGRNIVDGLANGIKGAIGGVLHAVSSVGSSVVSGIKSLLGIASPSTVFQEIGANVGMGLALGIQGQTGTVLGTMTRMGQMMRSSMMGVSGMGTGMVPGMGLGAMPRMGMVGGGVAGGPPIVVELTSNLQVDGKTLASTVTQHQLRAARGTTNVLGQYSGSNQSGTATGLNTNAVQR